MCKHDFELIDGIDNMFDTYTQCQHDLFEILISQNPLLYCPDCIFRSANRAASQQLCQTMYVIQFRNSKHHTVEWTIQIWTLKQFIIILSKEWQHKQN